ncbi:MAG: alpha/beta hydrolase [Acidimicrobiia bacterium]|nr:alpha/beta hydrolase [Acidimicrobiia bacterium]
MKEIATTYEEMARRRDLDSRRLQAGGHPPIHVLEQPAGDRPVVLVHGGGAAGYVWLPLVDRLPGRHLVVPDRPGFGLSDPVGYDTAGFRDTAVRFLDAVVDGLGVERIDLVGSSMGGTWSLWFALDRPERVGRLVLTGAAPLVPGTDIPAPLRIMATPGLGSVLTRLVKPSPKTVRRMMGAFGESETIGDHPEVVEAMVADNRDPVTAAAGRDETRAVITPVRGFRSSLRLTAADLGAVTVPTLLVWGSGDPVGGADVAERTADALADARLELLDAGHLPWLGHPARSAELIEGFLDRR